MILGHGPPRYLSRPSIQRVTPPEPPSRHRLLAAFALLCTLWSQAQVATLRGSITYEDGSAAALTSVAVVGEKASTQADEEGQFTLSVPA